MEARELPVGVRLNQTDVEGYVVQTSVDLLDGLQWRVQQLRIVRAVEVGRYLGVPCGCCSLPNSLAF